MGGVIVRVLASSAGSRRYDYAIRFKQTTLNTMSKDWLARNQINVERHVYPGSVVSVN
jgi:aminopeptidase-like protein